MEKLTNGHENDQTDELKSQNLALLQKLVSFKSIWTNQN